MNFPDAFLLNRLTPQSVFYDKKSEEELSKVTKPKYKIVGKKLAVSDAYPFFVLTTQEHISSRFSFQLAPADFENVVAPHLSRDGATDIRRIAIHSGAEVLQKCRDLKNCFEHVAKLCDPKFEDLQKFCHNIRNAKVSDRQKERVLEAVGLFSPTAEEITRKLGIS